MTIYITELGECNRKNERIMSDFLPETVVGCVTGQDSVLHSSCSFSLDPFELQLVPPFCGAGLSQFLFLVRLPLSHVAEQTLQFSHAPQFPLTK